MTNRLAINHVGEHNGEMLAHTLNGEEWVFDGTANIFLATQVREMGSINPSKWFFNRSIYGSDSYRERGEEEKLAYAEKYEGFGA